MDVVCAALSLITHSLTSYAVRVCRVAVAAQSAIYGRAYSLQEDPTRLQSDKKLSRSCLMKGILQYFCSLFFCYPMPQAYHDSALQLFSAEEEESISSVQPRRNWTSL